MQDIDVIALTSLPHEEVSCARLKHAMADLRTTSWSFQPLLCSEGKAACPSSGRCSRVAMALNRPLVSQLKVAA